MVENFCYCVVVVEYGVRRVRDVRKLIYARYVFCVYFVLRIEFGEFGGDFEEFMYYGVGVWYFNGDGYCLYVCIYYGFNIFLRRRANRFV